MRSARRFWFVFGLGAAATCAGMGWLTSHVIRLDADAAAARRASAHMDRVRLALWRMDSWLNTQLAPEAARPYFDYAAYREQQRAYTRALGAIQPGEVLTPSPLLAFRSPLFRLHFQVAPDASPTSPQVPTGNLRDLTEADPTARASIDAGTQHLAELAPYLGYERLGTLLGRAAQNAMVCSTQFDLKGTAVEQDVNSRIQQSVMMRNVNIAQQQSSWTTLGTADAVPGPLLPLWLDHDDAPRLVFARRVDLPGGSTYQGFEVDWAQMQADLLDQIADLFPREHTALVRDETPDPEARRLALAAVSARLVVPAPDLVEPGWNATCTLLAAAWGALLVALCAVGGTLGAALTFGNRRARFASAVTHELRSPLTTFRMYSEMLAEDMVTDPARRAEYLRTLCRESDRLARLVENVLAYARIEDGRHHGTRTATTLDTLVARIRVPLEQRVGDAGFTLAVHVGGGDTTVELDPDAVEQVLFGLVDNACKYAGERGDRRIELTVGATTDAVTFAVRDHGPGIPERYRRAIFRPFERGARPAGESVVPGVGLGLALARALAKELGGELVLDEAITDGASFVLRVPRRGSA